MGTVGLWTLRVFHGRPGTALRHAVPSVLIEPTEEWIFFLVPKAQPCIVTNRRNLPYI